MAAARTQPPIGTGASGQAFEALVVEPIKLAGKGTKEILKRPKLLLGVVVIIAAWNLISQGTLSLIVLLLALSPGIWLIVHHESFHAIVTPTLRNLYRRVTIYQPAWRTTMRTLNLHQAIENKPDRYPRILCLESTQWMDRLLVRPVKGSIEDYRKHAPALAREFGAKTCRISRDEDPHNLWVEFRTGDPLAEPIKPPVPDENVDFERIQVGITEDGDPWHLRLFGRHLLLAGETGAGKSSLIWAILWAIAPLIRRGLVQVWAIDPKGGMELGPGADAGLFARYADEDVGEMIKILTDARDRMDEYKASSKLKKVRKHVPTIQQPFVLVIIDEAAVLKLLTENKEQAGELERAQTLLLAQGRAPGITLLSALQVPTVAMDATRVLYPNRVQFQTMESRHFTMTLAPGVLEIIDPSLLDMPGKAFFLVEGRSEPGLGRVFHVEDEDIEWLGQEYGEPAEDSPRERSTA